MTDVQVFTEQFGARTFPWSKPTGLGYSVARIICIGAGGGGGSGCRWYGPTTNSGPASGGCGGGGGGMTVIDIPLDLLPDDGNRVTVGAPGRGGDSIATDTTAGQTGGYGTASSFWNTAGSRPFVEAFGGSGGPGGYYAYYEGQDAEGLLWWPYGGPAQLGGGDGGFGVKGAAGGNAQGFQENDPAKRGYLPGGAGGGGAGGAIASDLIATSPRSTPIWIPTYGGYGGPSGSGSGSADPGRIDGAAGLNGIDSLIQGPGSGGGGGAAGVTLPGGNGGNGGLYGGGGGGGGNGLNGVTPSGAGGDGGESIVVIITY